MNGIVHPCIHPDGKSQPKSEEQMFEAVFKYLDRIFAVVRPRKLIYFAFDGVAPRAKMNQQRARRFQSIKEKEKTKVIEEEYRSTFTNPPPLDVPFDSNVISPGTPFMMRLMKACQYYIQLHCNFDAGWKNIKSIFSGCEVPGEGEHKVINFIKSQRAQKGYDPNTKHVMVGLDADLIFLSLVTHEPYFYILREQLFRGAKGRSNFEFLNCSILRTYLKSEFRELPNTERSIDDFIFMCILVGNDFLPRLPSLEIQEGAIDALISTYKFSFGKMGGYICDAGKIDYVRLEEFLTRIGEMETFVFSVRLKKSDYLQSQRDKNRVSSDKEDKSPDRSPTVAKVEFVRPVVHVTQIPFESTEQEIYELFIQCGQIDQLVFPVVNDKPKGYALLSFVEDSSIEKALALTGTVLRGRELKVAMKKLNEKKKREWKEIYVGNFPLQTTRKDLTDVFGKYGEINKISLPENEPHKGFCFIEFKTCEAYEACLDSLKDTEIKVLDAVCRVNSSNERSAMDENTRRYQKGLKKKLKEKLGIKMGDHPDIIRLGDDSDIGWRNRYYTTNFGMNVDVPNIVKEYLKGLAWVTEYYFQGCPSWSWFYPYHYAPMGSDMKYLK
jgi:5'-3' exoribonuclease 2